MVDRFREIKEFSPQIPIHLPKMSDSDIQELKRVLNENQGPLRALNPEEWQVMRDILPFGEPDRTIEYDGQIMPMAEQDKHRDRDEIVKYIKERSLTRKDWVECLMKYGEE